MKQAIHRVEKNHYVSIHIFDCIVASILCLVLLPIWLFNLLLACVKSEAPIAKIYLRDAFDRPVELYEWQCGIAKKSLMMWSVLTGHVSFSGVPLHRAYGLKAKSTAILLTIKPGIYNLNDIREAVGYIEMSPQQTVNFYCESQGLKIHLLILIKGLINNFLYSRDKLIEPKIFELFGLKINNLKLSEAIDWALREGEGRCEMGFFVNVNSINIAYDNPPFKKLLNSADRILADGSGVRLGAKYRKIKLRDNINGTDLLPHLCVKMAEMGKSVFLLGSAPGVAESTAKNIQGMYPRLKIAGTHHGYFTTGDDEAIVAKINHSKADVLLVALGSPRQEQWIAANRQRLNVTTALAVGGLLDFFSGGIPRAPRWMREIGCEWLFRLMQEPRKKFRRYVVGNPLFLWRLWILKDA